MLALSWIDIHATGVPSCGKSDTLPLCEDTWNDDQPDHTGSTDSVVLLMLILYSVMELMNFLETRGGPITLLKSLRVLGGCFHCKGGVQGILEL